MATFTMQIATLSTSITGDNTKAAEAVKHFAWATGAPRTATPQELLDHAAGELIAYMVRVGRQRYIADAAEAAEASADSDVGFGAPTT